MSSFGEINLLSPIIVCLMASIIWAPIVYVAARCSISRLNGKSAGPIWRAALILVIAPTLISPILAINGFSLRTPVEPIPMAFDTSIVTSATPEQIETASENVQIDPYLTTDKALSAATLIYIYGGLLAFGVWAFKWGSGQLAFSRAKRDTDPKLAEDIDEWRDRLGVKAQPQVYRSNNISSVCMTGIFNPKIILPAKIDDVLSRQEIAVMCAHEVAHIKRGDGALFIGLAFVRIFFWFNPVIAKLTANIEQSAEEAADALVVSRGADRKLYANCFVEALKFAATRPMVRLAHAPSFTPVDREGRRKRLARILDDDGDPGLSVTERLSISTIIGGIAALALVQAAFAVAPGVLEPVTLEVAPLKGKISSPFGFGKKRSDGKFHQGIDIKAKQWTEIVAPADGKIIDATDVYNNEPAWGKVVVIDHGQGLVTRYAHLGKYLVSVGDKVKTGDVIAKVGSTGKSSGPHLHFEVIRDGDYVDPATMFADSWAVHEHKSDHPKKHSKPKPKQWKKEKAEIEFSTLENLEALGNLAQFEGLKALETLDPVVDLDPEALLGGKAIANTLSFIEEDIAPPVALSGPVELSGNVTEWTKKTKRTKREALLNEREKARSSDEIKRIKKEKLREKLREAELEKREAYREKLEERRERERERIEAKREREREHRMSKHEYRDQIEEQLEAISEARKDLEEAQRDGLPGVEGAIRELRETEKALKKAKLKLETERT